MLTTAGSDDGRDCLHLWNLLLNIVFGGFLTVSLERLTHLHHFSLHTYTTQSWLKEVLVVMTPPGTIAEAVVTAKKVVRERGQFQHPTEATAMTPMLQSYLLATCRLRQAFLFLV